MDWLGPWRDATRWWIDALAEVPARAPLAEPALLRLLVADVMRVYRGRSVGFDAGGRPGRGRLESIGLARSGGRLELRNVVWDGWRMDRVEVVADRVAVRGAPDVAVVASDVAVNGTSTLAALIAWVDGKLPALSLSADDGGVVEARRAGGSTRFIVDADVRDDKLRVELRGVRRGRMRLRAPRWLRLTRTFDVPQLTDGASVREAQLHGGRVEFRLLVPSVVKAIDPAGLLAQRRRWPLPPL